MTEERRRIVFLILVLAVVLGISIYALVPRKVKPNGETEAPPPGAKPHLEIGTNKVTGYSPSGEVIFSAEMERGEYDREKGIARLWGVKCYLMEAGEAVTALETQKFEFMLQDNRAILEGPVRAWSEKEGTKVNCEDLVWEVEEKRLWSDKPAEFIRGTVRMVGSHLESDLRLRKVVLYDGAKFTAEFKKRRR